MFRMVDVADPGSDRGDLSPLGDRLGRKRCHDGVAGETAEAADAVHHLRAADMDRIHVTIDVGFQRRIDRYQAETANDLGMSFSFQ